MSGSASVSITIDPRPSLNLENVQPSPKDNPQLQKTIAQLLIDRRAHLEAINSIMNELKTVIQSNINQINEKLITIENEIHTIHTIDAALKMKAEEAESSALGPKWGKHTIMCIRGIGGLALFTNCALTISSPFLSSDQIGVIIGTVVFSGIAVTLSLIDMKLRGIQDRKEREWKEANSLTPEEVWQIRQYLMPLQGNIRSLIEAIESGASDDILSDRVKACIKNRGDIDPRLANRTGLAPVEEFVSVSISALPDSHPLKVRFMRLCERAQGLRKPPIPLAPAYHPDIIPPTHSHTGSEHVLPSMAYEQSIPIPTSTYGAYHQHFQSSADYMMEWQSLTLALGLDRLDYVQVNNRRINQAGQIRDYDADAMPTRMIYENASPFTLELDDDDSHWEESTEPEAPHTHTSLEEETLDGKKESLTASTDSV